MTTSGDLGLNGSDTPQPSSSPSSYFDMSEKTLANVRFVNNIFDVYIPPIIFVLGVTGNILAIIIMSRPRFNKFTTAFYMRILAVFDTNLLTVVLIQHYLESNYANSVASDGFCKSFLFTDFTGFGLSNWVLVAMTLDRFLAVQFPLKAPIWCTIYRAKWSTFAVLIYFLVTNIHVVIFSGPKFTVGDNTLFCEIYIPEIWREAFYLYDMIVTILVPFFVLLVLNVQIIRVVTRSNKQRNEMSIKNPNNVGKSEQRERQLTTLLILVCIVFLVTSLPYAVDFIVWEHVIDYESDSNLEEIRNCSSSITYKFLYINPMINFYLYCLGCSKFRFELKMIFYWKCCCNEPGSTTNSEDSAYKVSVISTNRNI
ncbi:FMRFamide receptor-like [Tubulanus polymorphus]|uniref:FMRFamide receptor-like n=1 Tax=Tubulanus polymorphus TaxID=672921 RepID=UPI003DA5AD8A